MTKNIPDDVFTNNILSNNDFILVKDPKHTDETYHYTIWSVNNIETIYDIDETFITELKNFVNKIKQINLFTNEKIYFSFPPTHNRIHLHIVPINYVSYRPINQLYYFDKIDQIYQNIQKIKYINQQKNLSIRLEAKFIVAVVVLGDLNKINQLTTIDANYTVVIRKAHNDEFIEDLINNHKFINVHIISTNMNNYYEMINYDKLIYI
jgi:hypothetical protein